MTPWKVDGTAPTELLGFAMKYWHWRGQCRRYDPNNKTPNYCGPGTYSAHLIASHDGGRSFQYVGGRKAVLGTGQAGSFASRHVWIGPTPVVHNDELYVFFGGTNIPVSTAPPVLFHVAQLRQRTMSELLCHSSSFRHYLTLRRFFCRKVPMQRAGMHATCLPIMHASTRRRLVGASSRAWVWR
jgi:hypothetical protein